MHVPESLRDLAGSEAVQFLSKRKTVARIFAGVFSLIIFASLMTDGYMNVSSSPQLHCVLNNNGAACKYALVAGFLAFLGSLVFLILDTQEPYITSPRLATVIFLLDFVLSVIWASVWFVGFCFLANQWARSPHHYLLGSSSARASISFAFFSIPVWVYLAYLALQDLRSDPPVPYKLSLDEGGVIMAVTTLSSSSTTATIIPNSPGHPGPNPPPYSATPKLTRLAIISDN
ncbi:synaptogyrin-4 [Tachyglossus aculeatus]|uniref:synaptogyrin-4 n=1 Tax=Tachyglossus aculeatus TaxID=9261 RepID=UPI0018F6F2C2|nr:synaptogyrin-4 [Tachyglossus aculeatus]